MNVKASARRQLKRYGTTVTVTEQTKTGEDNYGDPIYDTTSTDVSARIDRDIEPDETVQAGGTTMNVDADIFIPDNTDLALKTVEAEEPTEIVDGSNTYNIGLVDDQGNGLVRLACTRE